MSPAELYRVKNEIAKGTGLSRENLFVSYNPETNELRAGEATPTMDFPEGTEYIVPMWTKVEAS